MNPMLAPMLLWHQGVQLWAGAAMAQTRMTIRMMEAFGGDLEPRSAAQLARDAEALREITHPAPGKGRRRARPRAPAPKPRDTAASPARLH